MAYDEELAARVRGALAGADSVEEKKMFRGLTFMVNGQMCVIVGPTEMISSIVPARPRPFLQPPVGPTVRTTARDCALWTRVNAEGMQRKKDFAFWIGSALDFNQRVKARKPKRSD